MIFKKHRIPCYARGFHMRRKYVELLRKYVRLVKFCRKNQYRIPPTNIGLKAQQNRNTTSEFSENAKLCEPKTSRNEKKRKQSVKRKQTIVENEVDDSNIREIELDEEKGDIKVANATVNPRKSRSKMEEKEDKSEIILKAIRKDNDERQTKKNRIEPVLTVTGPEASYCTPNKRKLEKDEINLITSDICFYKNNASDTKTQTLGSKDATTLSDTSLSNRDTHTKVETINKDETMDTKSVRRSKRNSVLQAPSYDETAEFIGRVIGKNKLVSIKRNKLTNKDTSELEQVESSTRNNKRPKRNLPPRKFIFDDVHFYRRQLTDFAASTKNQFTLKLVNEECK